MTFQIENNIPLPQPMEVSKYPFSAMKVGDSFRVEKEEMKNTTAAKATYQRKHAGTKFSLRKYEGAYRCWRLV